MLSACRTHGTLRTLSADNRRSCPSRSDARWRRCPALACLAYPERKNLPSAQAPTPALRDLNGPGIRDGLPRTSVPILGKIRRGTCGRRHPVIRFHELFFLGQIRSKKAGDIRPDIVALDLLEAGKKGICPRDAANRVVRLIPAKT